MAGAADFFATLFLLSSHHLLSLALGIFKSFLLLKSLCFFLLCLFYLFLRFGHFFTSIHGWGS